MPPSSFIPEIKAELILQNLETACAAIREGQDGMRSTVRLAERPMRPIDDVPPSDCPYIGIARGEETFIDQPGRVRCDQFQILICGVVYGADKLSTRRALSNIEHDIKRVIYLDQTRGADPNAPSGSRERNAIRSHIRYRKIEEFKDPNVLRVLVGVVCVYEESPTGV